MIPNPRQSRFLPRLAVIVMLCLAHAAAGRAQTTPRADSGAPMPPGAALDVRVNPQKATVGDRISIDFDITLPQDFSAEFPAQGGQIGDFAVLEAYPGPAVPGETKQPPGDSAEPRPEKGSRHHRARLVVTVFKPGDYMFPPLRITLLDRSGGRTTVESPALNIKIESILDAKDSQLKDLKSQAEIPDPARWLLWISIFVLACLLAAAAWWIWKKRRRAPGTAAPAKALDPFQLAEAELRDLIGRGLLEKNLVKQFYVSLSEIVKKILEAGYSIQTIEKTTAEILEELQPRIAEEGNLAELGKFKLLLSGSDLVKFARHIPSRADHELFIQSAFECLESCRSRKRRFEQARLAQAGEEK